MSNKAALIIIYNHRYDKNIDVLEQLYSHRFKDIYHLVPFYDGDKANVIPVYENSYCFQGYIAQGLKHYFKKHFTHYLFIGDDLLLNPGINESNYSQHFQLEEDGSFIPEVFEVHNLHNNNTLRFIPYGTGNKTKLYWWRLMDLAKYKHWEEGVENTTEMPGFEEAAALLKEHGFTMQPLRFRDLYGPIPTTVRTLKDRKHVYHYVKWLVGYKKQYKIAYPVVASYSDIVIVSAGSIRKFAHYCGVFATNALFVEFAIPTALLLSSKKVITEPVIGKRGSIFWTYTKEEEENFANEMRPYNNELNRLLTDFPSDKLYIHPVKLSKWATGFGKEEVIAPTI